MGLDMYLNRMPRFEGYNAEHINIIEDYLDWQRRKEDPSSNEKDYTFEEWCGISLNKVPSQRVIDFYKQFYEKKYSDWDTKKEYGYWRIMDQVGYWRKANQIHNWFVENIQDGEDDCGYHREVTRDDLEELLDICERIKKIAIMKDGQVSNGYYYQNGERIELYADGALIVNADEIAKLLPTQSGFFFGGTDYDSYYMDDIENTIDIITRVLETTDFNKQMIYYVSSW